MVVGPELNDTNKITLRSTGSGVPKKRKKVERKVQRNSKQGLDSVGILRDVECKFDTAYFSFLVPLVYNYDQHTIELLGGQGPFPIQLLRRYAALKAAASAQLELYSDHKDSASHSAVFVSAGDPIKLLVAWSPVSMTPLAGGPPGLLAVRHETSNVWLQLQVKGSTGWIHGDDSFQAVGLPLDLTN